MYLPAKYKGSPTFCNPTPSPLKLKKSTLSFLPKIHTLAFLPCGKQLEAAYPLELPACNLSLTRRKTRPSKFTKRGTNLKGFQGTSIYGIRPVQNHSDSISGCQMYPNFVFFPPPPRVVGHVAHVLSEHSARGKNLPGLPDHKNKSC